MIKFYGYDRCDTCRRAKRSLAAWDVQIEDLDITQTPPPGSLLKALLKSGYKLGDLFNRSGVQYRELNMKEQLKTLSEAQAIDLLASNGRLCKRPIVTDGKIHTVGYKADIFEQTWR